MRADRVLVLAVAAAFLATGARAEEKENKIPDDARAILDKADSFELLSLDPTPDKEAKDAFHGYKVLGKTEVKDADTRKKLVEALAKGAAENQRITAGCFHPRHGIRATHDKKTVELVICFECLSADVFNGKDDKATGGFLTSKSPQEAFDKVLKDAKVPLPKAPKD